MSTSSIALAPLEGVINVPSLKLSVSLSQDSTTKQALTIVSQVCDSLARQEASVERLRVLLGRILVEVQDRNLFAPDFASFEAYTMHLAQAHRISRATLRDSLMVARKLPDLLPEQAEKMPMTNLILIARASTNAEPRTINALMKKGEKLSIADFRAEVETQGLIGHRGRPAGTPTEVTIRVRLNRAMAKRWLEYVGDTDPAKAFGQLLMTARAAKAA